MILGVAAVVTFIFQKIRQPVVLGYIVAGIIVGPYTTTGLTVTDLPNIKGWAELGVIFLMFSLGLEFTFHKLAKVGATAAGTALVEVVLMLSLGYGAGRLLGWSFIDSIFLGGILSISSTTIIIKAFDELGLRTRRFAHIVFGILIVEDLVAILLLVALSTVAVTKSFFSFELIVAALKLIFLVGSWFLMGYFLIPSFFRYAGKSLSGEALTVLTTGLCLILVVVATHFHYSAALGAFIMGSILAETSEAHRIETLITPVRDLFAAVFFVSVGMLVDPQALLANWAPILVITLLTIVGKLLSSSMGALLTGQPLKRSIQIGFSLAQIGEFSFIIATLGSSLKVTSDFLYPIAVSVSVITTFTTPYLIGFSERFADRLEGLLPSGLVRRIGDYVVWAQIPSGNPEERKIALRQGLRFFLSTIAVSLIFIAMSELGVSRLAKLMSDDRVSILVAWLIAAALSAPFTWGMFFAFRAREKSEGAVGVNGFVNFGGRLLTVLWVGLLSSAFFPTRASLLLTLLAAGILFFVMYRRLERSYKWFESRFLQNVQDKSVSAGETPLKTLAPWDLHLTRLSVHQNSQLAGKSIRDTHVRSRFGLNIVAIQRGARAMAAPLADDILLPGDELLVLGTDEQIDHFRPVAEQPIDINAEANRMSDYALRCIRIDESSPFAGHSIRDSGLRQLLHGLVVGIERGTFRTINPEPGTVLQSGDLLWVVSGVS
jgi:CPA2 family monovalent cation:H+ antiporter-2